MNQRLIILITTTRSLVAAATDAPFALLVEEVEAGETMTVTTNLELVLDLE